MKKKILIIGILILSISNVSFSGIFGGGGGGPLEVIEIGENVRVNAISKIEQTKATLEAIQQTKNQIVQLKNDALNLNKWAGTILQETLGISQQDINNLLEIQRLTTDLYVDAKNFEKNWKKEFEIDFTKLDPRQLGQTHDKTIEDINNLNKDLLKYKKEMEPKARDLKKNIETFNRRNSQVTGNVDSLQLGNEIMTAIYSSINNLTATYQERELIKQELLLKEEVLKEVNAEAKKKSRLYETKRIPSDSSYEVYYF